MEDSLTFTRIKYDTNGNPRYVVHFLALNTPEEANARVTLFAGRGEPGALTISQKYAMACTRANSIGGRKYMAKSYGGGIVFQSHSLDELRKHINRVTGQAYTTHIVN